MPNCINILLVGVGGQGTILATRIISRAAQEAGYDVKVSEIHGMAQRGGSVVTQLRFGEKVFSPLIPQGAADIIVAFEKLEALRWLEWLKKGGVMIINDQRIEPLPVLTGSAAYPEGIINYIRRRAEKVIVVDALKEAAACGSARTANVVLVGILARLLKIPSESWQEAMAAEVPRFLEMNRAAFAAGHNVNI